MYLSVVHNWVCLTSIFLVAQFRRKSQGKEPTQLQVNQHQRFTQYGQPAFKRVPTFLWYYVFVEDIEIEIVDII
jgi:hypothetical protein